jgi:plasmid maintenance system antidote protein VapI
MSRMSRVGRTAAQSAPPVKKGDRFTAMGADVEVLRVSTSWADIKVTQPHGASWTKRQPLPFPEDWDQVEHDERFEWTPDWTIHPGVHWREMIQESGISQARLAEQMGVSTKHLSQILTCTVMPGLTATMSFARVMEVSPQLLWRLACDHRLALALGKTDLTRDYL